MRVMVVEHVCARARVCVCVCVRVEGEGLPWSGSCVEVAP